MARFSIELNDEERAQLLFVCRVLKTNPRDFLKSTVPAHFAAVREMIRNGVLQGEASATDQDDKANDDGHTDAGAVPDPDRGSAPESGSGEG
jgi:hypothetical protein